MSDLRDAGSRSLDMFAAALHGLDTIAELAHAGERTARANHAIEILRLISTVVDRLKEGFAGKLEASVIHENLLKLRADLLENDRDADTALDKKFPR